MSDSVKSHMYELKGIKDYMFEFLVWGSLWEFQLFLCLQKQRSIKWFHNKNMNSLMRLENLNKFLTMVHMSDLIEYDFQLVTSLQEHPFIPPLGHKLKCVKMTLWLYDEFSTFGKCP